MDKSIYCGEAVKKKVIHRHTQVEANLCNGFNGNTWMCEVDEMLAPLLIRINRFVIRPITVNSCQGKHVHVVT